jgi:hypothetical protein
MARKMQMYNSRSTTVHALWFFPVRLSFDLFCLYLRVRNDSFANCCNVYIVVDVLLEPVKQLSRCTY